MNENLRTFITENPMLVEAKRFGRKFFGMSRGSTSNYVFLALAFIIYLMLLGIAVAFRNGFSATGMLYFQTALFCFIVPALTYGAVAGEREKRTWELLIVAPISKAQIIIGKYFSALLVIGSVALLMLPLIAISFNNQDYGYNFGRSQEHVTAALLGELISLGFACGLAAMCIFISARTNRSLTSQAMIYSAIFGWLALFPMLVGTIYSFRGGGVAQWFWLHPFVSIAVTSGETGIVSSRNYDYGGHTSVQPPDLLGFSAPVQAALYIAMIALFLFAAIASIRQGGTLDPKGSKNAAR